MPHEQQTYHDDRLVEMPANVETETSKRMAGLVSLQEKGLLQEPSSEDRNEKLDEIGQYSLPNTVDLKKDFDAACQVKAVEHLVEQMTASLDASDAPKAKRMYIVAEAFMKVRQIDALGHTLMSEEELAAPPVKAWKSNSNEWANILEFIQDQFKERIGRGFVRRHLKVADISAYNALANWLRDPSRKLPKDIDPSSYPPELFVSPLIATKTIVGQRPSQRNKPTN